MFRPAGPSKALQVVALLGLLAPPASSVALAQSEIATYQGPDRTQRLVAGAKKEGTLTIYTSATVDDMAVLTAAFEKKYGIKPLVWRASSENIIQRASTEARGGRFDVDVFETDGVAMEAIHREKLLQEVRSPYIGDLIPAATPAHKEWIGDRVQIFTAAYNTRLVKTADLPKRYEDLLDPKWKGKLGIEANDHDWLSAVVTEMGEAKGLKLFRDLVARNGLSVRKGHTLLANLVVAGEVPLALTVYGFTAEQTKLKGAPIDWFAIPPMVARPTAAGMARNAPHPNAAVLFYDFLIGDAQPILASRQFVSPSRKIE